MDQYKELFQRLEEKEKVLEIEFNLTATKSGLEELEKTINQHLLHHSGGKPRTRSRNLFSAEQPRLRAQHPVPVKWQWLAERTFGNLICFRRLDRSGGRKDHENRQWRRSFSAWVGLPHCPQSLD